MIVSHRPCLDICPSQNTCLSRSSQEHKREDWIKSKDCFLCGFRLMAVNIRWTVKGKFFPISGGSQTNSVCKRSYKLLDNHLDLDLDAPLPRPPAVAIRVLCNSLGQETTIFPTIYFFFYFHNYYHCYFWVFITSAGETTSLSIY